MPEEELMQHFSAPLTPEDRKVARRINRIVLIAYSSIVLVLATSVVTRIALNNPTATGVPIEATTKIATIGGHS
jgi:hypothetical protein